MTAPRSPAPAGLLPSLGSVARAGVNGAAITAAWTGINETVRVRKGETTREEAIRATANSAVIGAGAGAAATIASSVARAIPLVGLVALAAGAGAIYLARSGKTPTGFDAEAEETTALEAP